MGVAMGGVQVMSVDEFLAANNIDRDDVSRMQELALDAVSGTIASLELEQTYDPDDTLTINVFPGVDYSVSVQLLQMVTRSPEYQSLRERTHLKVMVRCQRQ